MNRKELLNGVGKIFVTYGNGIINTILKHGIDHETEESIITFRQRVKEINKVTDELITCLKSKYGSNYAEDIKTVEANSLILERAINSFINNKHIYSIIKFKYNELLFDFFFQTNSQDVRDRAVEYMDAKNYLVLTDLEVLSMGVFKWYHADELFETDSKLCRIRMDKRDEYLSKWLKEKIVSSHNDCLASQLELILP